MTAINKIIKESSINISGSLIGNILNYIWLMILTRSLSQEDIGNFSLAQSLINITLIFALLGLHRALDRFIPFFNAEGREGKGKIKALLRWIFRFSLLSSFLIGVVLYWSAGFLSTSLFHKPDLAYIIRIVVITIPLMALINIVIYAFIGYKELRYNIYLKQIIEPGLRIIGAFLVAIWGLGVLQWSWMYVGTLVISALAGILFLSRNIMRSLEGAENVEINIKEIISYSWPISIGSILTLLIGQIDYIIIGIYNPAADVGIYRIYIQIAALLQLILSSVARIYKPVISELIPQNEISSAREIYRKVSRWVLIGTLLGFLVIALYGDILTRTLFTEAYSILPIALTILVLGTLINASFGPESVTLEAFGNTKLVMLNSLVALAVNIGLDLWLIPKYGIVGAATSTAVILSLAGFLGLVEIFWLYRMQPFTGTSIKIVLIGFCVGMVFYGINYLLLPHNLFQVVLLTLIITLVYGLFLVLTRSLDAEDIDVFNKFLKKIKL